MSNLSSFTELEKKVAERYLWWPIYLVREQRRLQGITQAMATHPTPTPEVQSAEEYLLRAEQSEDFLSDPLTIFDEMKATEEVAGAAPAEVVIEEPQAEIGDTQPTAAMEAGTGVWAETSSDVPQKKVSPAEGLEKAFNLPITDTDPKALW